MNRTKIEWCDYTWNPITGCSRGCSYCYARRMAYRLKGRYGYPQDDPFKPTFHPGRLLEPLQLKKPSKIFTVSMGEFFGPEIPEVWQTLILDIIFHCPQHTFQILTKQPQNIPNWVEAEAHWPSNIWLGVSVDGKNTYTERMLFDLYDVDFPHLKFVSFEPLLGPISETALEMLETVQWVIIGAQTGPSAKQPRTEWVNAIIEAADKFGIPVFIKWNLECLRTFNTSIKRRQEFPRR